ncbi:MAG: hypothetical protein ACR2IR_11575 [Acidimicrobiia bacterium]
MGTADTATIPKGRNRKLVVVANGPSQDGSVPVVVRNNKKRRVTNIEVQGTARDAAGTVIGSGSSQGIEPAALPPGGIGIGYVYFGFDDEQRLADATFKFTVSAEKSSDAERDYFVSVEVTEHNKVESLEFDFLQGEIVGIVRNPLDIEVTGPIGVLAACFDESGAPVLSSRGYTEVEDLQPGAESPFSVDYFETPCPTYLVGASGFNESAL